MPRPIRKLARCARAATAIEYGLILALVFMAMVGAVQLFAGRSIGMLNNVSTKVVGVTG